MKFIEEEYSLFVYDAEEYDPDKTPAVMLAIYDPVAQKLLNGVPLTGEERNVLRTQLKEMEAKDE